MLDRRCIVPQVGVEADLKNNYLARLSDVFALRHVKVVCASPHDDVAAESMSAPLWLGASELPLGSAGSTRPTQVAEAPACAAALRRALADAAQDQRLNHNGALLHKRLSSTRSRSLLGSGMCEDRDMEPTLEALDRILTPLVR